MTLGRRELWHLALVLSVALVDGVRGEDPLALRREYNQVAARLDTLVRSYGSEGLEALARRPQDGRRVIPAGFELVVIFWADDEAKVYLNGYEVGRTRLTPVQVVIPSLYLRNENQVRADCWDTDRVESGFMAGFYLRDGRGLRPVLLTEEGRWWAGGAEAPEIYYLHDQPDIPGAKVIWGSALFGKVTLEARFSARALRRAARSGVRRPPEFPEQNMRAHQVMTRLLELQRRRQALAEALAGWGHDPPKVRYHGHLAGQLAFSLGRAGPLLEQKAVTVADQVQRWARDLPPEQQRLLFRPGRALKGEEAATAAREPMEGGVGDEAVRRRRDYVAPPERGPVGPGVVERRRVPPPSPSSTRWGRWRGALVGWGLFLVAYLTMVGRQWWRIFKGEVWRA